MIRGAPLPRRLDARLSPEESRQLAALVRARGTAPAATLLACSTITLDKLAGGGAARSDAVERIRERLASLRGAA